MARSLSLPADLAGLGLQIAEALGEAHASLLITARKSVELEAAAAELQAKDIAVDWIAADASDVEQSRKIVETAMARFGAIDILVNNAGATWAAPAEEHTLEAWDKVMSLNTRGVFIISQGAARSFSVPTVLTFWGFGVGQIRNHSHRVRPWYVGSARMAQETEERRRERCHVTSAIFVRYSPN